ncbi:hypothetical protein HDU86_000205 [Geranomyces michiganensis]|nr:hypothetical protein HDU86_000205 [Geranomyces michiganensis]
MEAVHADGRYDAHDSCGENAGMEQVVVVPQDNEQKADPFEKDTKWLESIGATSKGDDDWRDNMPDGEIEQIRSEIAMPPPAAMRNYLLEPSPAKAVDDPFVTPRPSLDEQGNDVPDTPLSAVSEATIRPNPPRPMKTCSLFSAITPLPPFTTSPSFNPDLDDGGSGGGGFFEHDSTGATDSDNPDVPTRRASLAPSFASSNISALVAMYQTTLASTPVSPHASIGAISSPTNVRAAFPHEPVFSDEIDVRPGDQMLVEQVFQDGWAFGWNVRVGARGMFPLTTLSFDESALSSSSP